MIQIVESKRYLKDLQNLLRGSKKSTADYILAKIELFMTEKQVGNPLPRDFKDHPLNNSRLYKNCRECHIRGDTVLIYQEYEDQLLLMMLRIGNHNNLLEQEVII